jgi:hypothetical protein
MNKLLSLMAILAIGMGMILGTFSGVKASAGPVITQSFASKEIRPGDTWKIFLNASDPSGRMKYIYATVQQAGGMAYPLSMTRIKPENRQEFSGYVYLYTSNAGKPMDFVTLKLVVQLGDGAGNFSEPAIFPLEFLPRAVQASPPPGVFKDSDLGPVMIRLRPVNDDGDSGSSFGY